MQHAKPECGIDCKLTQHANARSAERGISRWQIETVIAEADGEQHVGRGCIALTVSRDRVQAMRADGMPVAASGALERIAVVLGPNSEVVTVMRLNRGRRSRVYRRGRR